MSQRCFGPGPIFPVSGLECWWCCGVNLFGTDIRLYGRIDWIHMKIAFVRTTSVLGFRLHLSKSMDGIRLVESINRTILYVAKNDSRSCMLPLSSRTNLRAVPEALEIRQSHSFRAVLPRIFRSLEWPSISTTGPSFVKDVLKRMKMSRL